MNIQQNLAKISWTAASRALYILYGFVTLLQIKSLAPAEFGLFSLLLNLQTWIFTSGDSLALQALIQFGSRKDDRPHINFVSLVTHVSITLGLSLLVLLGSMPLSSVFNEPRFVTVALLLPVYSLLCIPRTYCIKLLSRDIQTKQLFFVDLLWFGSMIVLTAWMLFPQDIHDLHSHRMLNFNDMIVISFSGMALSSLAALLLTRNSLQFSKEGNFSFKELFGFGGMFALITAVNSFFRQLDVFGMQYFFGTAAVGVYQSAKMLYRVFDTALDASVSFMYPTAIKLLGENRHEEFVKVLTKAVSFLFFGTFIIVLVLIFGFSEVIFSFIGKSYLGGSIQFNWLMIAACFVPLFLFSSISVALNKMKELFFIVCISAAVGLSTFLVTGYFAKPDLYPLGIVLYNGVYTLLAYFLVRNSVKFEHQLLFRAFPDTAKFIYSRILRKN